MSEPNIACPLPVPRPASQGVETVAVSADQRELTVTWLASVDLVSFPYLFDPASYTLTGGRRLHPRVLAVTQVATTQLVLHLDQPGDFSIYTLTVRGPTIDPFFAAKKFSFKITCADPFDCRPPRSPPAPEPDSPVIDYLTKDYAGFRQLLLDQIPVRLPEWTERSEADLGVAAIELFAEAADRLSYYQDRVANEAYLSTATQRRSVQLHTALIGYRMRPGLAATTLLYFEATRAALVPAGTQVQTRTQGDQPPVVFETGPNDTLVRPEHNALTPYTWDNRQCCLPLGATEVTVLGDFSSLNEGDAVLVADGNDPEQREIVTLVVAPAILPPDPVKGHPTERLTVLRWSAAQALERAYCLDPGRTIVRGNLVPATHGATVPERGATGGAAEVLGVGDESLRRLQLPLARAPLTFVSAPGELPDAATSTLQVEVDGQLWEERESLVESGPFDQHYRVELDDEGTATVVFGDGVRGQQPVTGSTISARYRIGIGPAGNVGRDTLTQLAETVAGVSAVTNPLAAAGGRAPEDKERTRRVAPLRIRTPIRCVSEADYERAATEYRENGVPRIQRAKARFRWTGSWLTVFINVDPIAGQAPSEALLQGLRAYLQDRKLAGYDLEISRTHYVPLLIGLQVCVKREFFAAEVQAAVLQALSNQVNPDGSRGFFHPDRFSFGDPVLLSRLYAALEAVPGVDSVVVTALHRLHERNPEAATVTNLANGLLPIGEMEIARLDNDASFPENGRLDLQLVGGR